MLVESSLTIRCGAAVYWSVSPWNDTERLNKGLVALGFNPIDTTPPATALRRAAQSVAESRDLVRPLSRKGAWEFVREELDVSTQRLTHRGLLRVVQRDIDVYDPLSAIELLDPDAAPLAQKIALTFSEYLKTTPAQAVAAYILDYMKRWKGVTLRDKGGVYYVSEPYVEQLKQLQQVLEFHSDCRLWTIPCLQDKDTVDAVTSAIVDDITAQLADVTDYILQDKQRADGIATQETRVRDMVTKLEHYQTVLGLNVDKTRDACTEALAKLGELMLVSVSA